MNTTERRELRNILSGEFSVMKSELDGRIETLQDDAEKEIKARYQSEVSSIKKITATVTKKAEAFDAAIAKVIADAEQQGIKPTYSGTKAVRVIPEGWYAERLSDEIREARADVYKRGREVRRELDRRYHEMNKQLSLTAITSEEARKFFTELPTIKELLPSAKAIVQ